ncbi:branched-chain amino acid transport system II carrier protein [Lacrimispora sp. 210928-DFI.3.58]|uniref:branched-chain amino acid transport system II carrier protein n=1 Tax=Lacrimispora sp. 210928-DFI.3.58 TaxID=2883214 RepID=UPI0015B75E8D|nr:branched-chain amino acid transport system II carrier protein [Lacrimispora sp. 210928-DFI.3.58]MCB7321174.1 branched-chain amino acid transport system II carrier protein [Lacrimispora sp. 210928-DFI.3.58]
MSVQRLSVKNLLFVSFTLFSMFFGAGNLIFPPFLAAQAGSLTWRAMGGFFISAVGFPVMGVAAVALAGGLHELAGRVGKGFASAFILVLYLAIGPFLAIPRTASTSFEMTVIPALSSLGISLGGQGGMIRFFAQLGYSTLFFLLAAVLALRPEKLTECLGKILCPTLLILISVIFTGCIFWPLGPYGKPGPAYMDGPAVRGFLEGYQTMDTIAALVFGIVIAMNIREKGIRQEAAIVRETVKAGIFAGLLMMLVYSALAYIGAPVGQSAGANANGARILTYAAGSLFGSAGRGILGITFFVACLNTCVGLLSSCSEYFTIRFPRISYRAWIVLFALISLFISSAGLERILKVSVPVLNALYPVTIVLIILSFLKRFVGTGRGVYGWTVLFTGILSIVYALDQAGISIPLIEQAFSLLPGYGAGLGWILPAAAGSIVGKCFDK